jgi:SAM-dependent methyltransferase
MAERGCDVVGIEIDPEAASIAETWAERVVVGDIEQDDVWSYVKDESFDVVLLGDILEHLRDPLDALRQAVSKLKPSGYVVTSLPNFTHGDVRLSLMLGRFEYADTGLLDRTHVRFFTADTIRQLHVDAGLCVVDTKRVIVPLFHSEIGLRRQDVDNRIVDDILTDPEAETYQFVTKSVRDNGTLALAELSERVSELTDHMHHEGVRIALQRKKMLELQDYVDGLRGHGAGLDHNVEVLTKALERSESERVALAANYNAVLGMRTVQLTAPIRWVYNKLHRTKTRAT